MKERIGRAIRKLKLNAVILELLDALECLALKFRKLFELYGNLLFVHLTDAIAAVGRFPNFALIFHSTARANL